jgi:hypothetical protein
LIAFRSTPYRLELIVKRSLVSIVSICAVVLVAAPAGAQQFPKPGTPVQVQVDSGVVLGTVHRRTWDSLLVRQPSGYVMAYERGELLGVRSYGPQYARAAKRGAKIGALVGLVALGASVISDYHMYKSTSDCICIPLTWVVAPSALASPIVGAGIGALFAQPGWSPPRRY